MTNCSPINTPMALKEKSKPTDDNLVDAHTYRSTVGALQYLTFTRPDITYAVNQVCQHLNQPTEAHFRATKRILRYLQGTQGYGVRFLQQSSSNLYGFFDVD